MYSYSFKEVNAPISYAKSLGEFANLILSKQGTAHVIGVIIKGFFLDNQNGKVLFLSDESFRGPLTINLAKKLDFKNKFKLGDTCTLSHKGLFLSHCTILIDTCTPIWQPPPIHFNKNKFAEVQDRCKQLAVEIMHNYSEGLFSPFLEKIIHMSAEKPGNQALNLEEIWRRLPGYEHIQPDDLAQNFLGLIGRGKGLTPAGDDFLVGFLLASHYLDQITPSLAPQRDVQNKILERAKQKTTTLSSALIQCAADGAADERLMNTLNWLAQGNADIQQVKSDLLSYGSSSGMDSFVGMLAAILLFSARSP